MAAGIDCCIAVSADGRAFSWGFSYGCRTGHDTDDTVETPRLLGHAVEGKALTWAGCGGQFSVVAGPAREEG